MKPLRILILVLLAVLLPLRGAVAAAMACPDVAVPPASAELAGHDHHGLHADHGLHDHDAPMHHAADEDATDDGTPGGEHAGTCQFCVSGCCVTPLASAPPEVAGPLLSHAVTFPALSAPVPAFQSDGPERPPRTI